MCSGVANWYSPRGSRGLTEIASAHARLSLAMLGADAEPGLPPAVHYVQLVADVWGPQITADPG
jgi:hypothetical protein